MRYAPRSAISMARRITGRGPGEPCFEVKCGGTLNLEVNLDRSYPQRIVAGLVLYCPACSTEWWVGQETRAVGCG